MVVEKCWRRWRIVACFYFPVFNKSSLRNLIASSRLEAKLLRSLMLGNILYRIFNRGVGHGKEKCQMQPGMLQGSLGDLNSTIEGEI